MKLCFSKCFYGFEASLMIEEVRIMVIFTPKTVSLKNGRILTIRNPEIEDAQSLVDYINIVSVESENLSFGEGEAPFTKEQEEEYIKSLKTNPHKIMAIGEIDSEIVAVSDISSPSLPRLKHCGDLGMSVMKKHWNTGVGTALMNFLVDWAIEDGNFKKINLHVKETNDFAIHLYKKLGFKEEGRMSRGMFINDKYFDLILMGLKV